MGTSSTDRPVAFHLATQNSIKTRRTEFSQQRNVSKRLMYKSTRKLENGAAAQLPRPWAHSPPPGRAGSAPFWSSRRASGSLVRGSASLRAGRGAVLRGPRAGSHVTTACVRGLPLSPTGWVTLGNSHTLASVPSSMKWGQQQYLAHVTTAPSNEVIYMVKRGEPCLTQVRAQWTAAIRPTEP